MNQPYQSKSRKAWRTLALTGLVCGMGTVSSLAMAAQDSLTCSTDQPMSMAPFHWAELEVIQKPMNAISIKILKGNPQDVGQVANLNLVDEVHPEGVSMEKYKGKWQNPDAIGMKTVTFYLSSDRSSLSYIAKMQPFSWSCK